MNFDEIISLRKAFKSVRTRQQQNTPSDLTEKIKKLKFKPAVSAPVDFGTM